MAEGGERPEDLSRTVLGGSDVCFDYYCNPCDEEGRHNDSVGFCKDCNDFLCDECFKTHRRTRPSRNHVLLDKSNMPKDMTSSRKGVLQDTCTDTCPKHPDRIIEHYCHGHDTLACSSCAFADHRKCQNVECIPDVAYGIDKKSEFKDMIDNLKDLESKASQIHQVSQDNIIVSEENTSAVITSMQTYTDEAISTLQGLQNDLDSELKRLLSDYKKRLEGTASNSKSALLEVRGILYGLETLQKNKRFSNLFVALKKAQKSLQSVKKDIYRAERDGTVDEFKFEPEVQLQNILRQPGALGHITTSHNANDDRVDELITPSDPDSGQGMQAVTNAKEKSDGRSIVPACIEVNAPTASTRHTAKPSVDSSPSTSPSHRNVEAYDMSKYVSACHVTDIAIKSEKGETTCRTTGMVVLSGDKLVAVDQDNCKVKVIDTRTGSVVHDVKLRGLLWDVTSVGDDRLAVTLPDSKRIQYLNVSLDGRLSTSKKIKVKGECRGICFSSNIIWVSFVSPGKVEALTQDGKVQLCVDQGEFQTPRYLTVSLSSDTIYVTDYDKKAIIRLSSTGQVLSVLDIGERPTGIAVAADGTIYVGFISCCSDCFTGVYMLTARNGKTEKLLTGEQLGGGLPISVFGLAYREADKRLFLGMDNSEYERFFGQKDIRVFEIEESSL